MAGPTTGELRTTKGGGMGRSNNRDGGVVERMDEVVVDVLELRGLLDTGLLS